MKAAVVRSFDRPLEIEDVPDPRARRRSRCSCASRPAGSATPTSTPPAANGRSSRRRRSSPATRASASIERVGAGNMHGLESGMRVALPWLGYACGDCRYCNSGRETLCPSQLNTGYAINGGFAEYAVGYARHVVRVPGRRRSRRRRAADLRRRDDLQGGQGLRGATSSEPRRGVRRRRPRPPRRPVRAHHRRGGRRRRHQRRAARDAPASSAPSTSSTPREEDPVAAHPAPRRRRRGDRHRRQPVGVRAGLSARSRAAARSSASACRPTTSMRVPIFETVLGGLDDPRLDRRHPPRPRRGLRAAPPRA